MARSCELFCPGSRGQRPGCLGGVAVWTVAFAISVMASMRRVCRVLLGALFALGGVQAILPTPKPKTAEDKGFSHF